MTHVVPVFHSTDTARILFLCLFEANKHVLLNRTITFAFLIGYHSFSIFLLHRVPHLLPIVFHASIFAHCLLSMQTMCKKYIYYQNESPIDHTNILDTLFHDKSYKSHADETSYSSILRHM